MVATNMTPNRVPKKSTALAQLTQSALAIVSSTSGVAVAAEAPTDAQLDLRFTQYREADMPEERVTLGDRERYAIDVTQFRMFSPVGTTSAISLDLMYETMSGASPLGSQLNNSDQTEVLMSGASIEETRTDVALGWHQYSKYRTYSWSLASSIENDYESIALGWDFAIENRKRWLTLLSSLSASYDTLSPTDADVFGGPRAEADGETKTSVSAYGGFNAVVNAMTTVQMGVGFTQLDGYLSDPYRGADQRPDQRQQVTLDVQIRRYLGWLGAAWHVDYRYYQDDWEIKAHTIEQHVYKQWDLGSGSILVSPSLRYYWQHQASFYQLNASPSTEFYSSDYRLSAYGAAAVGLDLTWDWHNWGVQLGYSLYLSDESWGASGQQDTETPSLVDFTTVSFGLFTRF